MKEDCPSSSCSNGICQAPQPDDCSDKAKSVANPTNIFDFSDVTALESLFLAGNTDEEYDINDDGDFTFTDIIAATQCHACLWDWQDCGSSGDDDDDGTPHLSNLSPSNYQFASLNIGDQFYIDRDYPLTEIPSVLSGATWIMTANADKWDETENYISFDASANADVYVIFDSRVTTVPDWLQSWNKLSEKVQADVVYGGTYDVYRKQFSAGTITLGGNRAAGSVWNEEGSNYVVAVK